MFDPIPEITNKYVNISTIPIVLSLLNVSFTYNSIWHSVRRQSHKQYTSLNYFWLETNWSLKICLIYSANYLFKSFFTAPHYSVSL